MFRAVFHFLWFRAICYFQLFLFSNAAVIRTTRLRLNTSVVKSKPLLLSGDSVTLNINIEHDASSLAQAVDIVLELHLPVFLKFRSHSSNNGLSPTGFEKESSSLFLFKYSTIRLSKFIKLSVTVDVDPYFLDGSRQTRKVAAIVNFWYYGEDGPCARPSNYFNAHHEKQPMEMEFIATQACEKPLHSALGLSNDHYFASSVSTGGEAALAALSNPGVWLPAQAYSLDRNQFLQIDFQRLVDVRKIATRGMATPYVAYVRSYHLYYAKDLLEWSSYHENYQNKLFEANSDGTSLATTYLPRPILARYLRVVPREWKAKQALQIEVYGCPVHPNESLRDFCPLFDFESGLSGWSKTGTAFNNQPTTGDNFHIRTSQSANIQGQRWIATAEDRMWSYIVPGNTQGDAPVGTLTSPKFFLAASKLYFLIGGTPDSAKARTELLVDGAIVRTAFPGNTSQPDVLTEQEWDVKEFLGKEAVLRLVDDSADGHLNFDALRIDCYLDGDAQDIDLYSRSVLLSPSTHSFYVCDSSSHLRLKDESRCKMTTNSLDKWVDIPDVQGLLGVDQSSNKLYAVSVSRRVIVSLGRSGKNWRYITRSEWEEAKYKPTMLLVRNVDWKSAVDGEVETTLVNLNDSNGEKWRATTFGIQFKGITQAWRTIAVWHCQGSSDVSQDACVSDPCEHGSKCTSPSPGQYFCTCPPGYTGVHCEQDIDDCVNHDCLNGASCIDSNGTFYCRCPYGYRGEKCNLVLPACRPSLCLNGGTCEEIGSGNFKCNCVTGYRGTYCEILFNQCGSLPCQNGGVCTSVGGTDFKCNCPHGYSGKTCGQVPQHNFVVLSTATVEETYSYLVIKAQLPTDGKSSSENWCRDYDKLCTLNGHRRPTGFGLSYNHIRDYARCQENYMSFMDPENTLGTKPNSKVAELAQKAGFLNASASNSFAFHSCNEASCLKTLVSTGCDPALSCINRALPDNVVYTVCVRPNAYFHDKAREWTVHEGVKLLVLLVEAVGEYSRLENWCYEYEALCKSYGLRPIGRHVGSCRTSYNAMIYSHIRSYELEDLMIDQYTSYSFTFETCSRCDNRLYDTRYALDDLRYTNRNYKTACSFNEHIGFKVLDEKKVKNYSGYDYIAVRVQVPLSGKANGKNWCKDYQLLCESYDYKPVGDRNCNANYNSVRLKPRSLGSASGETVGQVAIAAGFSEATQTNSFAMSHDCDSCSHTVSDEQCSESDLFCINQDNPHRVFYTVCIDHTGVLRAHETRSSVYKSTLYSVIKTEFPGDGRYLLKNWCEEYQTLCEGQGAEPTGCGAAYSENESYSSCQDIYGSNMKHNNLGCGNTSSVLDVARAAGFSSPYPERHNTFAFHQCSVANCETAVTYDCSSNCACHPALGCVENTMDYSRRDAYAVCVVPDHAFEVLDTKETNYNGNDLLVVKARLPPNGRAISENWCQDYRRLCLAYGRRPTGCGKDYSHKIGYVTCRSKYQSVMPENNEYDCPPNVKVSIIAKLAGFISANSGNSFGFSDCSKTCVKTLTADNLFISFPVSSLEVYTVCETSDSNFKVTANEETVVNGGKYLLIQAEVPSNYLSKHADWCTDYQRLCQSYGLRPVGLPGGESDSRYSSCIKEYGAINTKFYEANNRDYVRSLAGRLGYSHVHSGNTFTFGEYCPHNCFNDIKMFDPSSYESLMFLRDYDIQPSGFKVYTVCATSDSNFHVLSTKSIEYEGQTYLVVMATLPGHRESKYESWCEDYERLCRTFKMRPTGCGLSYQWSWNYRSCVEKFQSAMAENDPLGCNSSENIARLARMAGFDSAFSSNSFAFHQCAGRYSCPKKLTETCPDSLSCLNDQSDVVYTVCTDSASVFIVEHTHDTREHDLPLVLVSSSLPAVFEPKNNNWCVDYQKLCASLAARPVGCGADLSGSYETCHSDYNAVSVGSDLQGCERDGYDDIHRLENTRYHLGEGKYFKFHKCSTANCKASISDSLPCNDAIYCLRELYFVYTVCSRSSSNFEIKDVKSTSYGELDDILAIEASIPAHGESLYDTWCEDYEKLCSVYGKKPLACPWRTDYVGESRYRSCQEKYNAYMMVNSTSSFTKYLPDNTSLTMNSTLPCPLTNLVVNISQQAGFRLASPENSIAFSKCSSCSKNLHAIRDYNASYLSTDSTCPTNANCSKWPTDVSSNLVHLLCVKPPQVSTFEVVEKKRIEYLGRKFIGFRLRAPSDKLSRNGDWCTDYQKLCESVSLRPIACGSDRTIVKIHRDCRLKYNAVMLPGFTCSPKDSILSVLRSVGFGNDADRTFGMHHCSDCSMDLESSGLHYLRYTSGFLYTACANSDSGFEVLQTREVTLSSLPVLVIKAKLPTSMISSHESWCKDYEMLCASYGKRPLSCPGAKMCQTAYNALSVDFVKCDDVSNSNYIPKSAGFSEATKENTVVLHSCQINKCSRRFSSQAGCNGPFGCINSSITYNEVYTMCMSSTTAYDVIATKKYTYSDRMYLVLRVKLPDHATSKAYSWCHDYRNLCKESGFRPLTCYNGRCKDFHDAIYLTEHACPVASGISFIASRAGFSHVTDSTNFAYSSNCMSLDCKKIAWTDKCTESGRFPINCYDRSLNDGEFTTICVAPTRTTVFPVHGYKKITYSGRNYMVVRTQKEKRSSRQSNWCHDYSQLCYSFGMRPLACSATYTVNNYHHRCHLYYGAVVMENVLHRCPLNDFVAQLAQLAGFTGANPANSFAFLDCDHKHCKKQLDETECNEALYCLNTIGHHEDVFTVCTSSDSAFQMLDYKTSVGYGGKNYGVYKTRLDENQISLYENWCKDYQRLCESFHQRPLECYNSDEPSLGVCTQRYNADRAISCDNTARAIATNANLGSVSGVVVLHKCTKCPKKITKQCSESLDCARKGIVHVVCAHHRMTSKFKPLQTRSVAHGEESYLLIQTQLRDYRSHNWRAEYRDYCNLYGYLPIACGKTSVSLSSTLRACRDGYEGVSSEGDDFGCPPSTTISILARQAGFYEANNMNTFAFHKCNSHYHKSYYYGYYLSSSSCYERLTCLKKDPPGGILYTMCAKPLPSNDTGFKVLDKKTIRFLRKTYLALKVKISVDGISSLDTWCDDYREMCRRYNAEPTGCGFEKENQEPFSSCNTKYDSFMPYNNILKCGTSTVSSNIIRRAGFSDANKDNSFVFNRCDKCKKTLNPSERCDGALHCLHSTVWAKEAYTLCTFRPSAFDVISTKFISYGNTEYLVIEAALPSNMRALHENWCHDYQKLCHSFGKFPVACSLGDDSVGVRKYADSFDAVEDDSMPCPSVSTVVTIAKLAGYSAAKTGNSFMFAGHLNAACSKDILSSACTSGLDCLNSQSRVVYTLCTNPTNFEVSDVRKSRYLGNTFSVIQARLPASGIAKANTWCDEYTNLCRALNQQPVACKSLGVRLDYEKCRDNNDAFLLADQYGCHTGRTSLHQIALRAGFANASLVNTFGLMSCSSASCQKYLSNGTDCDPAFNCMNLDVPDRQVFAICLKEGNDSNFHVQETKEIKVSNVVYSVIRAVIPWSGKSKHDTWCKDYDRLCLAQQMRPVRCSSQDENNCLSEFNTVPLRLRQFDCHDNANLVQFVKQAGYSESSSQNTFIYGTCGSSNVCTKILDSSECNGALNCLKRESTTREVYTVCVRSLATSFHYLEARSTFFEGAHYLVIKTSLDSNKRSTGPDWCYDYRDMCMSYGKRPVVHGNLREFSNYGKLACYTIYNGTSTRHSQNSMTTVAESAGFKNPGGCIASLRYCYQCFNTFYRCPFHNNCNCDEFYLICL